MFDDFMNHRCNIYHLEEGSVNAGYGIVASPVKAPEQIPSLQDIPCHFHTKANNTVRIIQNDPFSSAQGEMKLSLPYGTEIRENDTVEDCSNGLKYRAGIPRTVHGDHHIVVTLNREGGIESAI